MATIPDDKLQTAIHALYIAAERFDEHVLMGLALGDAGGVSLAETFKRQAKDLRELAELLEAQQ